MSETGKGPMNDLDRQSRAQIGKQAHRDASGNRRGEVGLLDVRCILFVSGLVTAFCNNLFVGVRVLWLVSLTQRLSRCLWTMVRPSMVRVEGGVDTTNDQ